MHNTSKAFDRVMHCKHFNEHLIRVNIYIYMYICLYESNIESLGVPELVVFKYVMVSNKVGLSPILFAVSLNSLLVRLPMSKIT